MIAKLLITVAVRTSTQIWISNLTRHSRFIPCHIRKLAASYDNSSEYDETHNEAISPISSEQRNQRSPQARRLPKDWHPTTQGVIMRTRTGITDITIPRLVLACTAD